MPINKATNDHFRKLFILKLEEKIKAIKVNLNRFYFPYYSLIFLVLL